MQHCLYMFSEAVLFYAYFPLKSGAGIAEGVQMVLEKAPGSRRRLGSQGMVLRRRRIFARLREGLSYEEIAGEEGVSAERIRQIVTQVLQKRAVDSGADHAKLQLDRLAPAMQLAAEGVAAGDVSAIAPYLKVLDRLDRYQSVAGARQVYDDEARQKLLDKLNRIAANLGVHEVMHAAAREHPEKLGEFLDEPGTPEAAEQRPGSGEEQRESQSEASQWMSV
jgi:DNA-binding CsgD family transcriptional regulator